MMSTPVIAARAPSEASRARNPHRLNAERRLVALQAHHASVSFPAVRETRRERTTPRAPAAAQRAPRPPAVRHREAAPGRGLTPNPPIDGIERLAAPDDARKR